jgi:RNA polymerase subunit RPABC4/transcription elongation factor Spt4
MVCGFCMAILETAIQCPNCEKILTTGYVGTGHSYRPLYKLLYLFRRGAEQETMVCHLCKYKGRAEEFNSIVLFEKTYSVIEF